MRTVVLFICFMATAAFARAVEPPPSPYDASRTSGSDKARLQTKLAELKALQAEIQGLRKELRVDQQLLISVRMLEAVPKRFQEAGIELQDGSVAATLLNRSREKTENGAKKQECVRAGTIADGGQEDRRLRRWRQQRLLKCIAEPQLVTISGRPASFRVGGHLPAPVAGAAGKTSFREFGTHVELVALARDDGTIRLEIRASHNDLDFNHTATFDGMEVPGLIVREVDTAATLQAGETLVVGSFVGKQYGLKPASGEEADEAGDTAELIVLATVEYVDAM